MKLFKEEDFEVTISEEALTIKAFKDLIKRDKSRDKREALKELSFIYFYIDPRSEFNYIVEDSEKQHEIKQAIGLSDKWKIDDKVQTAIDVYTKLVVSPESLYLDECIAGLEKARLYIRSIDFNEKKRDGTPVMPLDRFQKAVKDAIPLINELKKARIDVEKQIVEEEKIRGSKIKTVTDDGFNKFM